MANPERKPNRPTNPVWLSERRPTGSSFTDEQISALSRQGYNYFLTLNGNEVLEQLLATNDVFTPWTQDRLKAIAANAINFYADVAFNPEMLFLPGTKDQPLEVQRELIATHGKEINRGVGGVKGIMGYSIHYGLTISAYQKSTGHFLFGKGNNQLETDNRISTSDGLELTYLYGHGLCFEVPRMERPLKNYILPLKDYVPPRVCPLIVPERA